MLGRPLRFQPGKIGVEGTLSTSKDIGSLAAQNRSREAATVARPAHDLLDRRAILAQPDNDGIGLFPTEIGQLGNLPLGLAGVSVGQGNEAELLEIDASAFHQ